MRGATVVASIRENRLNVCEVVHISLLNEEIAKLSGSVIG